MRDAEYLCKPCGRGEVLLKHIGPETRTVQKIKQNKWKLTENKRNSENKNQKTFSFGWAVDEKLFCGKKKSMENERKKH